MLGGLESVDRHMSSEVFKKVAEVKFEEFLGVKRRI